MSDLGPDDFSRTIDAVKNVPAPDGFSVTVEEWDVYRAWLDDHVTRWCLVHDGAPIGPNFETREAAVAQAEAWGWPIAPDPAD